MRFSVITPSFRSSKWLKLCVASVADQKVQLEHIVQDAGSDDGTLDWLTRDLRVKTFVEKDIGMYDAVNRGLGKSSGDILSYLNCDEQYLPGALAAVLRFFDSNPAIEIVFGDVVIVNPHGEFLSFRKSLLPLKPHSLVSNNLSILTCATFFRRSLIEKRHLLFNPQLRDLGDADWILRCIEQKVPMALLNQLTSAFTDTGLNMNAKANAAREKKALYDSCPTWLKVLKAPIILHHRFRKLLAGAYTSKPFSYEIYTLDDPEKRTAFHVSTPTGRWNPYTPQTS
jgi:glycosyltransferase involved in cell wall biosynthesis